MITYKIDGCDATFKSKPENFDRDVLRWKQRHSLRFSAEVTILENDEPTQLNLDSTSNSDASQLETVSEDTGAPKRSNKRKPKSETADVPVVSNDLDISDLPVADEPATDLYDSAPESN